MIQSIIADIKREFATGNVITRLVITNVAVFFMINCVYFALKMGNGGVLPPLYDDIVHFFSISSSLFHNLTHPWVFVTSIFLHLGLWHLFWNMIMLYWFGKIVADLVGGYRILPLYLLGGLVGGLAFWGSALIFPFGAGGTVYALGASAGVMAIVVASGIIAPDYHMNLILIGPVKLKYIVAILVILDIFALAGDINTGGHFAHLGGAIMGWVFVTQMHQGNDWSEGINSFISKIQDFFRHDQGRIRSKKQTKLVVKHHYRRKSEPLTEDETEEKVDRILDKIKEGGYQSLTQEEKKFLHNVSGKR